MEPIGTKNVTMHKTEVQVPIFYQQGHTLNEHEAEALNAHFVDAVRGRVGGKIKQLVENGASSDEIKKTVEQAAREFEFGQSSAGRPSDPVETEAMNISRGIVRDQLKAKGYNLSEVKDRKITELAKQVLQKNPKIREQARQNVEQRASLVEDLDI